LNRAATVAQKLLQIKAIKLSPQSPFTWSSGIQSPIYCDNRIILSYPDVRNYIKQALASCAQDFDKFDKVAGVATAGIAHGALLADASIKAVEAVRATGASVVGVLAIFSYGFTKAQIAFDAVNCPFKTLSNYSVLINEALKTNYIQENDVQLLTDWFSL